MTGIFRTNNPLNTFLLFVYGILLKFAWLSHPQIPVVDQSGGFLFNDLIHSVKPYFDQFPKSYFLVAYLLLFSQAITLNQVIISRRMMQKPDFLPAMSYLLITSFFPEWNILSAPLIVNSFLIWVWSKMSNLNSSQHPKTPPAARSPNHRRRPWPARSSSVPTGPTPTVSCNSTP